MIRSAVTISLVPEARGGPFVFWDGLADGCAKAGQIGFDAVEIFPPGPEAIDPAELRRLVDTHALKVAAVGTGAGWVKHKLTLTDPDADGRLRAKAFVKSIIDAAGAFNAPAIIGSMQGRWGAGLTQADAVKHLTEALDELGAHAAQYRVPLIYEPLNRYETNMANTISAGVQLLRGLTTPNVKLLADLFHMNIEEVNVAEAIRGGRGFIGHVHLADSNRRPAGNGHTDFVPVAAALREIGYDGYASAEVFAYPDPESAARQTMEAYRRCF